MIDWFTVVAQIVNFPILVGLLRYFLYGRILEAMDKREQEIADRWEEAHQDRDQAANELNVASRKNRELDEQRERSLARIQNDVEEHRQQLTSKVRGEVDDLRARWSNAIRDEAESFLEDLRRRASEEVCAIARQALTDLANASLETLIVERFLEQVQQLSETERTAVIASLDEGGRLVVVQTTLELPDGLRQTVSRTLRDSLLDDLDIRFEQSKDLICGIALQTDAHKLAWDLRDYLSSLEQQVQQMLQEETTIRRSPPREATATG